MNRPSRRASRPLLPLVLTASAALGVFILLPQPSVAQAMGGLGQRSNGSVGGNAQAAQNRPQQPAPPVYSNPFVNNTPMMPMQNNNAPVFSSRVGGYQAPPTTVAPVLPPAASVNSLPRYNTTIRGETSSNRRVYNRWNDGASPSGTVTTGDPAGSEYSNRRVYHPRNTAPGAFNDDRPIFSGSVGSPSVRVTTPIGQRSLPRNYYNNDYFYNAPVTVVGGPSLLGGYYYGNYCDTYSSQYCYPSVFSVYYGFPQYIVSPSLIVIGEPYYPTYYTSYLPFEAPTYQVTYNQNNYYVASEQRAQDVEKGGEPAQQALKMSFPADSYQAAFADIEHAWKEGRISLLRKHLREDDVKLSIYFQGKYSYSIASADFAQITRDAFDRLNTVSFQFTRLRKAKNGDLTAYGKHVYRAASDDAGRQDSSVKADDSVPFSTDGADSVAPGVEKTVYVSYTLRRHEGQWYIVGVNSSPTDMIK